MVGYPSRIPRSVTAAFSHVTQVIPGGASDVGRREAPIVLRAYIRNGNRRNSYILDSFHNAGAQVECSLFPPFHVDLLDLREVSYVGSKHAIYGVGRAVACTNQGIHGANHDIDRSPCRACNGGKGISYGIRQSLGCCGPCRPCTDGQGNKTHHPHNGIRKQGGVEEFNGSS